MIYLFDKILENYYEQVRKAHLNWVEFTSNQLID
jgi:hypothetical protein